MLNAPAATVHAGNGATQKVRLAEDAWNSAIPTRCRWPTRQTAAGVTVPSSCKAAMPSCSSAAQMGQELDYRLIKELWAFTGNRIAVRFAYEWHDDAGSWFRAYGNENWEFDDNGLMRQRFASINDLPIGESQRLYHWPLGRRPDDHQGLSELKL